jgi:hypothetical protein
MPERQARMPSGMQPRLDVAKPDIVKYFDSLSKPIFETSEIDTILRLQRESWRLEQATTTRKFIDFLTQNTPLKPARFAFPYRPVVKYTWGDVPLYALLLSLRPGAYLTHSTAMYFHRLTDQAPKVINLNVEQTPKRHYASSELTQDSIDLAFENPTRMSHNVAEYGGHEIRMLNGLHTGNVGVTEMPGPEGETLRITDVERTLIDIAVRPEYSGGVSNVVEAYRRAADKVSIKRLTGHLKSINYIYPYHQAIGFYLAKAGSYRTSQIGLLRKFEISHDFYLAHQIRERDYSSEWRLFYPKGLD